MSGPDRIWIDSRGAALGGNWGAEGGFCHLTGGTEYIRRDPATLAALPEVQALIAGAYEAAARQCRSQVNSAEEGSVQRARWVLRIQAEELAKAIEALTPADAIAARDAMLTTEREACIAAIEDHFPGQLYASNRTKAIAAIRKRGEGQP